MEYYTPIRGKIQVEKCVFGKKPFFAQGVAETTKAARKDLQRAAGGSEREGWIHRRGAQPPKERREAMLYRALRRRAGGLFAKRPGEKPAKAARRGGSAGASAACTTRVRRPARSGAGRGNALPCVAKGRTGCTAKDGASGRPRMKKAGLVIRSCTRRNERTAGTDRRCGAGLAAFLEKGLAKNLQKPRGGEAVQARRPPVRPAPGAPPVPAPDAGRCRRALQWSAAHQERARKMSAPGKDNRNLAFAKRKKRHREINTACFYRCGKAE